MRTALGKRVAPTYANIFVVSIGLLIKNCAILEGKSLIHFCKIFIDDIIMIWIGTVAQFEEFMIAPNNKIHIQL
jgi:hypothetical protein